MAGNSSHWSEDETFRKSNEKVNKIIRTTIFELNNESKGDPDIVIGRARVISAGNTLALRILYDSSSYNSENQLRAMVKADMILDHMNKQGIHAKFDYNIANIIEIKGKKDLDKTITTFYQSISILRENDLVSEEFVKNFIDKMESFKETLALVQQSTANKLTK